MAGIDYKEYLKSLGTIETDAKKRIQAYLEEQIKEDAALRELYRAEKINDCYDFIKNAVKATGCGSQATVEDAIVFKMARDYYLDFLPKESDEVSEVKTAGAETAAEAETEAETEPEAETEDTTAEADNENSGTPCEEAEPENKKPAEQVMLHQADETEGESVESENSEAETEPAATENQPADNENEVVRDDYGFEIFGEEPESKTEEKGAETAAEAETEAETEPEAETEDTTAEADNENSGTPCEEAEPENKKPAEQVMLHQADETEGESVESENSEAETEPAATENQPADNENEVVRDDYGFEIFGEEPESKTEEKGAETAAEATMDNIGPKAEPENEKPATSVTRYDEEGQGLFEF